MNLGTLNLYLGKYEKAIPLFIEAKEVLEASVGNKHQLYANCCYSLSAAYRRIGNYDSALPFANENIEIYKEIYGEDNYRYASGINTLGLLYLNLKEYEKAHLYLKKSLEIRKEVLGEKHPLYFSSLNNMAYYYEEKEELDSAQFYFEKATMLRKKYLGEEHHSYATALNNLATVYLRQKAYKKALPLFLSAKEVLDQTLTEFHQKKNKNYSNLMTLYTLMGSLDSAEVYGIRTLDNTIANLEQNFTFLSGTEKEKYLNTISRYFDQIYAFSNIRKETNPRITEVCYNTILLNKGILLKSNTAMRFKILNSKDPDLIKKYEEWIMYRTLITKENEKSKELQSENIETWKEKAVSLERELVQKSQAFNAANFKAINWKDVQSNLKENEFALEFIRFNSQVFEGKDSVLYAALIIDKKCEYPNMVTLFHEQELVKIFNQTEGNDFERTTKIYGKLSEKNGELYNLIWKPLEEFIPKNSTVYFSPDGVLHKVSFFAIGDDNWYLSDNYRIQQVSSSSKIGNQTALVLNKKTRVGLIGGVNYNTEGFENEVWSYLPGTELETDQISKALKKKKIKYTYLKDTLAKEGEVKRLLTETDIAHISTHGYFYPDPEQVLSQLEVSYEDSVYFRGSSKKGDRGFGYYSFLKNKNPLNRSGLTLTGANKVWNQSDYTDGEDGVLTANEVSNLNMLKNKLVVLSACETGLGDIRGAEGVYGLQRAFKMAGAKYIVMSLWQVPDKETQEFMVLFYKNLIEQKQPIRIAFESTQFEMKQKYDPYFWAAFVLVE